MAGQKGRDIFIQVESPAGSGTFIPVGGLRTKSLKISNEPVDITNSDSSGIRRLLEGAGVNSIEVSGAGVFVDDAGADLLRQAAETNEHLNYKIGFPGDTYDRTYTGSFMAADFEETGEYNGAMTFTVTLQSADEITKS